MSIRAGSKFSASRSRLERTPSIFTEAPKGEFSLTKMFDRAEEQGRLFGLRLDGLWMHVGTPVAVHAAEEAFLESVA